MWSREERGSVAIAGPFDPSALVPWLDASEVGRRPPPQEPGGALLGSMLAARLRRGMPTIAITSSAAAAEPIAHWRGPLLRLWVVRRRARGALRDGYHEEVRLLRQALREAGAAATHAHWTYEYARAALGPGLPPAVVTVHDHAGRMLRRLGPRYVPHYLMARHAYRRAAALTAPSPWLADYVARRSGRDVRVIPNPLDDALVGPPPPRPARTDAPAVVTVASDARFKNARAAVAALARWRARGAAPSLRLVGPGLHADGPIAAWARARGLADGVQFEGPVGHREALGLIADADILLHPSLEESFGNAVMEAMALGVPVVAAREAAGCRFLLDDGQCGRLASGRSPADLADALLAAWTRPEETAALAAAAGRRVRELCDPDVVLGAYDECYAAVAARS